MNNGNIIVATRLILYFEFGIKIYVDECKNRYEPEIIFPDYLKN